MSYDGRWANITQNRHACQLSPAPQSCSVYVHVRARKVSLLSLSLSRSLIYVSLSVSVAVSVYIFPVPVPFRVPVSITRAISLREGSSLASTFIERTREREREIYFSEKYRNILAYIRACPSLLAIRRRGLVPNLAQLTDVLPTTRQYRQTLYPVLRSSSPASHLNLI